MPTPDQNISKNRAVTERILELQARTIEAAIVCWCKQLGVTPEQLSKTHGFTAEHRLEGSNWRVIVTPHLLPVAH